MFTRIKDFLSILPMVGPYFEWRFLQSNEPEMTSPEEPGQTHADWASEQVTVPLRVIFPDAVRDRNDEVVTIQNIAERLGVDSRDLEDDIFELRRGKRLVVIQQRARGIKAPVFERGIDLQEIAEKLRDLVNPSGSVEYSTLDQIEVRRQFKMFDSIASALGAELDIVIHEHEIGLRRSERPFDNGGVGIFIFQDEPVLKNFRMGTFRVPPRFKVVETG